MNSVHILQRRVGPTTQRLCKMKQWSSQGKSKVSGGPVRGENQAEASRSGKPTHWRLKPKTTKLHILSDLSRSRNSHAKLVSLLPSTRTVLRNQSLLPGSQTTAGFRQRSIRKVNRRATQKFDVSASKCEEVRALLGERMGPSSGIGRRRFGSEAKGKECYNSCRRQRIYTSGSK